MVLYYRISSAMFIFLAYYTRYSITQYCLIYTSSYFLDGIVQNVSEVTDFVKRKD